MPLNIFKLEDKDLAIAIAREIKFANIVFINNNEIETLSAPIVVSQENNIITMQGHLWKKNPLYDLLNNSEDNNIKCKIVFNVADRYISPSVYTEKQTTGQAVPTWNYLSVQFDGRVHKSQTNELLNILNKQIVEYETMVDSSWQLTDAPPEYIIKLQQAIFGFNFIADKFFVTAKMSQDKSDQNIKNILEWYRQKDKRNRDLIYWHNMLKAEVMID
jgi:transcriptional regulator